jgi:hypothetical protein
MLDTMVYEVEYRIYEEQVIRAERKMGKKA